MKNGLSKNSPNTSIYEYSEIFIFKKDVLKEPAENLILVGV